jgi:uncharacterized coiled-coil protein SlyX
VPFWLFGAELEFVMVELEFVMVELEFVMVELRFKLALMFDKVNENRDRTKKMLIEKRTKVINLVNLM